VHWLGHEDVYSSLSGVEVEYAFMAWSLTFSAQSFTRVLPSKLTNSLIKSMGQHSFEEADSYVTGKDISL